MSQLKLNIDLPYVCLILILIVVGCTSSDDSVSQQSEPTEQSTVADVDTTSQPPIGLDPTATIPAPSHREPIAPITLDNVAQIDYLGRLDAPGTKSTIFNWVISPDGTQLVALNNDLLMEWNIVTGRLNFSDIRRNVTEVLYSPDKNEVYGIEPDGNTFVYESITGDALTSIELHDEYSGIYDYDDLNGWLAVAGTDGSIKVWDVQERESLVTFDAHEEGIVGMEFSSDGLQLATTAVDGIVKLWNWQSETLHAEYSLENAVAIHMVFSPDDSQLAVSTRNFVAVWDVFSGNLEYVLQSGADTANEVLTFSPDGKFLLTAGEQGNMRLWDAETSDMKIELPDIGGNRVDGVFSPDSTLLATTLLSQDASLWNLMNITDETVGRAPLNVQSSNLFGVEWSSDGYSLIFFDTTGEIHLWGIPTTD